MFSIRDNAILVLHEMGLMQPKVQRALAEDVLPWLLSKTQNFLDEDREAVDVTAQILEAGIVKKRDIHGETLARMDKKRKDAAQAKHDEEIAKVKRRVDRKIAREIREKESIKAKLLADVNKFMIEKGGLCVSDVLHEVLVDIHGCYEKNKPYLGALGGMIQQWYYVIQAIGQIYEKEDLAPFYRRVQDDHSEKAKKAHTPRELIMERFMVPFLLVSIKELKPEFI
jgi:hypothetical protein